MAAAGSVQQQQGRGAMFAAACGALSRYVKAAAVVEAPRPAAVVLPLMPGADVPVPAPEAGPPASQQQLTISYGGRVVVVDDVPAVKAAELVRAAAAARGAPRVLREGDLPMARKASLQRFMEKRKGRAAARAVPYSRPDAAVAAAGAASFPEDHLALCTH